jgi:hypothetical protein
VVSAMAWPLNPQERPGIHCLGGWVGPRAVLHGVQKMSPLGFDLWIIQPVASRYTNYTILAYNIIMHTYKACIESTTIKM